MKLVFAMPKVNLWNNNNNKRITTMENTLQQQLEGFMNEQDDLNLSQETLEYFSFQQEEL